jgi:hypothetical protein
MEGGFSISFQVKSLIEVGRQDNRLFIEAVPWIIRTGTPWRIKQTALNLLAGNRREAIQLLIGTARVYCLCRLNSDRHA